MPIFCSLSCRRLLRPLTCAAFPAIPGFYFVIGPQWQVFPFFYAVGFAFFSCACGRRSYERAFCPYRSPGGACLGEDVEEGRFRLR